MIKLTRLNNQPLAVNSDLIKFVEQAPDTVITLVTGEKLVVRESAEEVLERIIGFRRAILHGLGAPWEPATLPSRGVPGVDVDEGPGE
ncbi:MAG TPA: flagellar FlbD family protein [Terriglobales bacterium]|nr:flagellar FlbD family protein [Terriglobales bacterium]